MVRATENVVAVFSAMLERPAKDWYGLELAKHAEIGSATIYAVLGRLEGAGLLESKWESVQPSEAGRPRRRLYSLTANGSCAGRQMVAEYKPRVRIADRLGDRAPGRTAWGSEAT
jgi:DNA-binding PadR family transcriptional regulator